jgi:hypothetical protein
MISQQNGLVSRKPILTKVIRGKQIIYRFNGDPRYDHTVADLSGTMAFRHVGQFLTNNGKRWRVEVVRDDLSMFGSATAIPIHRVFLTDRV